MIKGIGIDSVEIKRFSDWANQPKDKLQKIFSDHEIDYCLETPKKSPERFAARFAVKEAFFKALSQVLPSHEVPFLTVCKSVSIQQEDNGNPQLIVEWDLLTEKGKEKIKSEAKPLVSITHTVDTATALVIVEKLQ